MDQLWVRAAQQNYAGQSISMRLPANNRAPVVFTIDAGKAGGRISGHS